MPIKKRPFHFFLLSVLLTIIIGYLINTVSPNYVFMWKFLVISLVPVVMMLFVVAVFSFFTYLFHSYVQGILIGFFVGMYLVLRIVNISNIFFLILLLILFGTLELFFLKKK